MRVLVTGGRGFIGARLVDALVERGDTVRILDDGSRGEAPALDVVETFEADVRDGEAVRAACRDVDLAVHLAAVQGTGNFYSSPDLVLDVNLRGVLNIADACATEGVRRLVFSSSSEVYGLPSVFPTPESEPLVVPDPTNPRWSYGGSKIVGELVVVNAARRHGFEYVILRYHNVYGPAMGWDHVIPQFVSRLARGETFTVQGDGSQRRAFCYVDDAVAPTLRRARGRRGGGRDLQHRESSRGAFRRRPHRSSGTRDGSRDQTAVRAVPAGGDRSEIARRVARRGDPRAPAARYARGGSPHHVRVVCGHVSGTPIG